MVGLKKLEVYTDGACRGNPGLGAYAYTYLSTSNLTEEFSKAVENTTNNRMELTAILECLREIKVSEFDYIDHVTINTDSRYSIDAITKWSNNWNSDEFKNRPNGDIIKEIREIRSDFYQSGIKVIFNKVKCHSDNQGNNRADKLCNEAMDEYLGRGKS